MHHIVLVQMLKSVQHFAEQLDRLILLQVLAFFDVGVQVSPVAVFHDQVEVIGSLLHVVEPDNVRVLAALQHLDLALEQLPELAYLIGLLPLTLSLWMDLTAISLLVARS